MAISWTTVVPSLRAQAPGGSSAHATQAPPANPSELLEGQGPAATMGAWYEVPLPPLQDRMIAIHVALLPNRKVLMVNGSSNREQFIDGKVKDNIDVLNYDVINNSGLLDTSRLNPTDNKDRKETGFRRIASPPLPPIDPQDPKAGSNDLFCSGHLHLPDGNVLFVGGSRVYYPGEQFTGNNYARVFDWQTETWKDVGKVRDGHWYPSLIPLPDGKIAAFSGLGFRLDSGNSPWVEFYNPTANTWSSVNIENLPNSPFNTHIPPGDPTGPLDQLDHYPRIFPLPNGKFLITGNGSGNTMSETLQSRNSYYMSIDSSGDEPPRIAFEPGPQRQAIRKVYSSAVLDPNQPGDILMLGGMYGTEDINRSPSNPFSAGQGVTADMERFHPGVGKARDTWSLYKDFMGDRLQDTRMMQMAVILPSKQILVVGGGNYGFAWPVFNPLLLTPDPKAQSGYTTQYMNPALGPRMYHNNAILLPDGRVLTCSGNGSRAARDAVTGYVHLNIMRTPQGVYQFIPEGTFSLPAEDWLSEIFYPPYLFTKEPRPVIASAPSVLTYGQESSLTVENATEKCSVMLIKLGSATHSWDSGQRLIDLPFTQDLPAGKIAFTAPKNRLLVPPGYYMLFYVNDHGKPAEASIVQMKETL